MLMLGLLGQGAACAAAPSTADAAASRNTHLAVPFVAQEKILCGGACLAMVMRYWGERGIGASDFSRDLDTEAGITTTRMLCAARERGYEAHAFPATRLLVRHYLDRGCPLTALIGAPGSRLHYVTVIACSDSSVTYHDPARRPGVTVPLEDFMRAWSAGRYWALVVTPPRDHDVARGALDASVVLASDQVDAEPAVSPALESFRLRLWSDAEVAARGDVSRNPDDATAWHVLGASQYMLERRDEALSSWNRAGAPALDIVQVRGLERTRHEVVTDALGLDDGRLLTPESLHLARRRIDLVPAVAAGRVDYRPVASGMVEVDVTVREHPLLPDPSNFGVMGVRALTERRLVASLSSPTGNGEVLEASYRWWEERPRFDLALFTPELFGVRGLTRIGAAAEKQTYAASDKQLTETTREASIGWTQWLASSWMYDADAGYHEIRERGNYASLGSGITLAIADDRIRVRAGALIWERTDGNESLHARFDASVEQRLQLNSSLQVTARAGWGVVDAAAPRLLWPGAGTGHGRETLLRAHPLLDSGVITGDAFAPSLVSASGEMTRWFGAGVFGTAAFVDAACPIVAGQTTRFITDAGIGLRVHPPGHRGQFRIDLATGLSERTHALSIAWQNWN